MLRNDGGHRVALRVQRLSDGAQPGEDGIDLKSMLCHEVGDPGDRLPVWIGLDLALKPR